MQLTGLPAQDTGLPVQVTGLPAQDTGLPAQDTACSNLRSGACLRLFAVNIS